MGQELVVAFIVGFAAFYAGWRALPASLRRTLAQRAGAAGHRAGWIDERRARTMVDALSSNAGCGSCKRCNGCGSGTGDLMRRREADASSSSSAR